MSFFTGVAWWPWLIIYAAVASAVGTLAQFLFGSRRRKRYWFDPLIGMLIGLLSSVLVAFNTQRPFIVVAAGLFAAYLFSGGYERLKPLWLDTPSSLDEPEEDVLYTPSPDRVLFRPGWDARPRYENEDPGVFVGRDELLERMKNNFVSKPSGTILISGVRGVGKTALVDRALIQARNELQQRYWKQARKALADARFWHLIDRTARRTLEELVTHRSFPDLFRSSEYCEEAAHYAKARK